MEAVSWISLASVVYAYFGYPLLLLILGKIKQLLFPVEEGGFARHEAPRVSVLIPAHNEQAAIGAKVENTLALDYPGSVQIIIVSDGSTDNTAQVVRTCDASDRLTFLDLRVRKGKANALNAGLEHAKGDIVVFSDASILLNRNALWEIVQPFSDPQIGCVSGEDHIEGDGGEGLYGKYELFLRKQESRIGSIVGASGSFYAQRRCLAKPFLEGVAPDFLSVLSTVAQGARAVSEPRAIGYMTAVKSSSDEFQRKVRTLVRGMTALFAKKEVLNPLRYPTFSFFLLSHKLIRWWVPFFLLGALVSNALLLDQTFFLAVFIMQLFFYGLAALALYQQGWASSTLPGNIVMYFAVVNLAILVAWTRYLSGIRQEIWTPSNRSL